MADASVAIIGMGALGLLFADEITRKGGDVCFAMDRERLERNSKSEFTINGKPAKFRMYTYEDAGKKDFVIISTKATGLKDILPGLKLLIKDDTVVISAINGIVSEEIIGDAIGHEHMIYTVAQGMDAEKYGTALTYINPGELRIGAREEYQKENLRRAADFLEKYGVPHTVEDNIMRRLWAKFMLNVGINQVCHAFDTNYGGCTTPGTKENRYFMAAMDEVIALSEKTGINLTTKDRDDYAALMASLDPKAVPSMRQDGINKRRTEVEIFSGTVIKLAKQYGVPVPVNTELYKIITEKDASWS